MAVGVVPSFSVTPVWDDPLDILPRRKPLEFLKDETIYTAQDRADSFFLVVDGAVKLGRISPSGRETILDFCPRDSFFGESSLLGSAYRDQTAVAFEDCQIMEWTTSDLHQIMCRAPELGPSLLRVVARKLYEADRRIESFAVDHISQRLIKALLRLADTFGAPLDASTIHIMPVTHELLGRYVGTSREIITQHMNHLRNKGLLLYSRAGIEFDPAALRKELADPGLR